MLYRCLRSGRTVEINDPEDIEKMKDNESYVIAEVSAHSQGEQDGMRNEVKEDAQQGQEAPQVKKRGRPYKK
mgnify:CR=1 FL=1